MELTKAQKSMLKYRNKHKAQIAKSNKEWADKNFFDGNRIKALERDGYCCVKCGMTQAEHLKRWKRSLTIDHIDGKGIHVPIEQKNNSLDNLQTLCCKCHGKKDGKRTTAQGRIKGNKNLLLSRRRNPNEDYPTHVIIGKV